MIIKSFKVLSTYLSQYVVKCKLNSGIKFAVKCMLMSGQPRQAKIVEIKSVVRMLRVVI